MLEEIRKLTLDPAALDSLIAQSKTEPEPAQELFADRMSELEKQAARLLNLYQAGVVEIEEIQERLGAIKEERAKLQPSSAWILLPVFWKTGIMKRFTI